MMARKKTTSETERAKADLAARLKEVRAELYGEDGAAALARALGVPSRTWYNYERGVTVPAGVLLRLIELTGVEPTWLLHGRGAKYRGRPAEGMNGPPAADEHTAVDPIGRLIRFLEGGRLAIEVTWGMSPRGAPD
jgi:DNA-binding transcriptional regulator YiaG